MMEKEHYFEEYDTTKRKMIEYGNQKYYEYDTVYCISAREKEYSGFLINFSERNFVQVLNNKGVKTEFMCYKINPLRQVLTEKTIHVKQYYYERIK